MILGDHRENNLGAKRVHRPFAIDRLSNTAAEFERFANSEYGVSGEELSAACITDIYSKRLAACHNGNPLILPKSSLDLLRRIGAVRQSRCHLTRKQDVDWQRIKKLQEIRKGK